MTNARSCDLVRNSSHSGLLLFEASSSHFVTKSLSRYYLETIIRIKLKEKKKQAIFMILTLITTR